jgi:hypothetical protein
MRRQVIVSWGDAHSYPIDLESLPEMSLEAARQWLDGQYLELGCEPLRPSGKVLIADKVLSVAMAAGQARFAEPGFRAWNRAYALAVSALLGKPIVRIDVPALTVGY